MERLKKGLHSRHTHLLAAIGTLVILGTMPTASTPATLSEDGTPLTITSAPPVSYEVAEAPWVMVMGIRPIK